MGLLGDNCTFVASIGVGVVVLAPFLYPRNGLASASTALLAIFGGACCPVTDSALSLGRIARQLAHRFFRHGFSGFQTLISIRCFHLCFCQWHATDISWPPLQDSDGLVSPAREVMEENRIWMEEKGINVCDDVDVFDILGYLDRQNVRPEEVVLCIFNCAHGRNYRVDSTDRHELMKEWKWNHGTFRSAAFQAMCGQLPEATCILTSRCWEPVATQASIRPIIHVPVRYAWQGGPPYRPEPSTRNGRRPGELGSTDELVATVAVGPALAQYILKPELSALDIPEVAFCATGAGHVVFIGEFTLANSRHCAQYVCDHIHTMIWNLLWLGHFRLQTSTRLQEEKRQYRDRNCYTYAQCLQHVRGKSEPHSALAAAHLWMNMWSRTRLIES